MLVKFLNFLSLAALILDLLILQAMLHSNVSQTTPLLVLSCQPNSTEADASSQSPVSSPVPPVEVAQRLKLSELEHPWQVIIAGFSPRYSLGLYLYIFSTKRMLYYSDSCLFHVVVKLSIIIFGCSLYYNNRCGLWS